MLTPIKTPIRILVIDGQGGKIGLQLLQAFSDAFPEAELTAVGTNSIATQNMLKATPTKAATGENAVLVACRKADFIAGPIGIIIADSLCGEISPAMSVAIAQSTAYKVLIPIRKCGHTVVGMPDLPLSVQIKNAVAEIQSLISQEV